MNVKNILALSLLAGMSCTLVQAQTKAKAKTTTTKVSTTAKSNTVQSTTGKAIVQAKTFSLANAKDSLSYALGADVAKSMKSAGFDLNIEAVHQGFKASFSGAQTLLTEDQINDVIQEGVKLMMEKKNAELSKEGKDFLTKNAQNPNVKVLENGLQYEILTEGTGAQPTVDDEVEVHYEGTLINGDKFDSSYDRNAPLTLRLNSVIEGWKIGIPMMKVGSKYKFYIPQELGYGGRASGPIPAFSTLIFTVELLDIKK